METIKKILACQDIQHLVLFSKCSKDDTEVLALPSCNFSILSVKQSFFPDQCKIVKVMPLFKKAPKCDQKATGPSHWNLLCLR